MANSFAHDTFRRADGTLTTPWTLHPTASAGAALISSRKIRASSTTTVLQWHNSAAAFVNGTISTKTTFLSGTGYTAGVVGRLNETAATFYSARMNNSGAIELIKSIAGTITVLGSFTVNLAANATIRVGLRMNGSTIEALRNGVVVISVSDVSITAAGRCGVRMTGGSSTTAGLHMTAFSATDQLVSPPEMPTSTQPNMANIQSEAFDEDVERGGFVNVSTGSDRGLLDPTSPGGEAYAGSFKTKAVGPIPNETNVDYDASLTTWVQDGLFVCEMFFHSDGRAKGGAIKPIPYPDQIAQTYGRWRYAYRLSDTGTGAAGFGTVFDFISSLPESDPLSWKNGSGEYGHPENGHGNPTGKLGSYIRDSDGVFDPNRAGHVIRRNNDGTVTTSLTSNSTDPRAFPGVEAPTGMNDWHIGEAIFEPGRTRLLSDGITIWDDTTNPVHSPLGFLMQNGKPGSPTVGQKAQVEIGWIVIDEYIGEPPPEGPVMSLQSRLAAFVTAVGTDIKSLFSSLTTTQRVVYWNKTNRTWGTRGSGGLWTWKSTNDSTATAPPSGSGQLEGDVWQRYVE